MLRIIKRGFYIRNMMKKLCPDFPDHPENRSLQLLYRAFQRYVAFCLNHIHNSLSLRKIQSPVQKSTFCKFSGFRYLRSVFQNSFQNSLHGKNTAMTVNFYRVFSCICFWTAHYHHQNFIYRFLSIADISIMNGMSFYFFYIFLSIL